MTEPKPALISIITPVYNAEKYLLATIESVSCQTYSNFEHILVIDQNTTDQSLNIALSAKLNDPRIRVIHDKKAKGAAINRNIGLDEAKGDYICFLDADDTWPEAKLARQLDFMKKNNNSFSFTSFQRMSEDGTQLSPPVDIPDCVNYYDLLKLNVIAIHTVMIASKLIGPRRFPNIVHEDFAFWLDLLRPAKGSKDSLLAKGLNEPLAFYRKVPGSRAHNKASAALWRWRVLRSYEHLPLLQACYYFVQYACRALRLHQRSKV